MKKRMSTLPETKVSFFIVRGLEFIQYIDLSLPSDSIEECFCRIHSFIKSSIPVYIEHFSFDTNLKAPITTIVV